MNEHGMPPRHEAIDIGDFAYGATGARLRRLTMPDGSHWFPASDVCRKLGYTRPGKALLDHVPEEHRERLETLTRSHGLGVPAGREWRRDLQLIDLQGLVLLVIGCTKPACTPFREWVAEVVLSAQRYGSYALPEAEVQPSDPTAPAAYAMPARIADAIVRSEERNLRSDEEFAAVQRESFAAQHASFVAHQATAPAMERIADRLDVLLTDRTAPPAVRHPRLTAEAVLAGWKARMSVTGDVWAVAVTIAPALAQDGELRQSLESIAERTGLPVPRVDECLRLMREHACIRPADGTEEGPPVYVLHRP
ncbi:Bro-N domain-containing protein [Streptomyces sp. Wb2n-11]|uniref:BRO-N domain-containing protein n=1 Tax=Streptomyces sp. Wb2n-11 TaxID=1030533 RepID=UPI000A55924A|nr:Bro-N domain-containing protein [Streptomyces sp. Wb2n-11]